MKRVLNSALLRFNTNETSQHPSAEMLAAFSDSALSSRERERIFEHLAGCAPCREWLSSLSEKAASRHHTGFVWSAAMGVAASLCAFAFVIHLGNQSVPPPPMPGHVHIKPFQQTVQAAAPAKPRDAVKYAAVKHYVRQPQLLWRIQRAAEPALLQRSVDGGKSWAPVTLGQDVTVHSVAWTDNTTWVRDERGAVLQSRDAGAHWESIGFSSYQPAEAIVKVTGTVRNTRNISITKTGTAH